LKKKPNAKQKSKHQQRYTKIKKSKNKRGLSIKLQVPLKILETAKFLGFQKN
jgi:hypothetical protein